MKIDETQADGLKRTFRVVVPAADLEQQLQAKIEEVRPQVRINGFRPGKVPASHIRKVYGPGMMQDILNATIQKSTQASFEQAKVRPAIEPQFEVQSDLAQVQAGGADFAFDLKVEIIPEFEPVDLKTISITRPVSEIDDAMVDEALATIVKANRTYEEKEGPAVEDDSLTIDFLGKKDGEPFAGGAAEDATIVIGAKQFIPGFEESLIGLSAGDEKTFPVTFPEAYPVESLAGQEVTFDVKVKKVSGPKAAEADEEFAKQMGFDDLAALKAALRERMVSDFTTQSRSKAKRALFDELDKAHDIPLPPSMVEAEFNQIWGQIEQDKAAGRLDPDDAGKTDEQLRADYRRIAERRVRLGLVLAEIGRRNKVELPEQDVQRAVAEEARKYQGQEKQVFDTYMSNPQLLDQIRAPLYEERVVDFSLELVNVANQTVSRQDLFAEEGLPPA